MSFISKVGNFGYEAVSQLNPLNWSVGTQKRAIKVAGVACIAFLVLTALERFPVGIAAKVSQLIYDCAMNKELNAVKAYGVVFANTWDTDKADAAYKFFLEVGGTVDLLPSNTYFVQACQVIADKMPYNY